MKAPIRFFTDKIYASLPKSRSAWIGRIALILIPVTVTLASGTKRIGLGEEGKLVAFNPKTGTFTVKVCIDGKAVKVSGIPEYYLEPKGYYEQN